MSAKLRIGNVELDNKIILAPMAGVTDLPFRLLCKEQGAGLLGMEMISAKGIYYGNRNTEEMLTIHEGEKPVSLQLFGSDPVILSEMARKIEDRPFAILDINMGCPVPKVVGNGEGSALMTQPLLVGKIVEMVSRAIAKPVTVKIRKGFTQETPNAPDIAYIAQESGAAGVIVHGRTRDQYYHGKADWEIIAKVKQRVKIPVIGNGDVTCAQDALRMMQETGCDGVAIGRAAQGNPWIFAQIRRELEGQIALPPSNEERRDMMLRHAALLAQYKGEYTAACEMRKHLAWYTTGYPHSAKLRGQMNSVETMEELTSFIELFYRCASTQQS